MNNRQEQKSGNNSTNIQATNIYLGPTYLEMKEIALDVFKANFCELAGKARDTVEKRCDEITEDVLRKLQAEYPNGFLKSEDPDFQHALLVVQKEYARSGDKELGSLLVDLLVDRSKQEQRNILQIVLNESLTTAPKLTDDQLATLSIIFLFKYTHNKVTNSHQKLGELFDTYVLPFATKLNKRESCYQHLQFSGCGSYSAIQFNNTNLDAILSNGYQGLFLKGFDAELLQKAPNIGLEEGFFCSCLNDPTKLQVSVINKVVLEELFNTKSTTSEDRQKITTLFDCEKMSEIEVTNVCVSIRPYMSQVFDIWNSSQMKNFQLTSVGMAIGHANIKRFIGEFTDLATWIN